MPSSPDLQFAEVQGIRTRYWRVGQGPRVLVLHGWGAKIESVHPIVTALSTTNDVLAVDLPGFGESGPPPVTWGVGDYAGFVAALLDHFEWERPSVVGHSFGGKTAIYLAAREPQRVNRLLLVDAAGIKPHRGIDYYAKVGSAKLVKHTAPYLGPLGRRMRERIAQRVASSDYANAGALRPTFVKVLNEHFEPLLPEIKAPTLLIWGEKDTATPISDGQLMERLIPDAALITFPGAGHFSYLDDQARFTAIARNFLAVTENDEH
jgi:pimeloyl-ACP methyl ester carboxylesterase